MKRFTPLAVLVACLFAPLAHAGGAADAPIQGNPFGVAPSNSSSKHIASWLDTVAATGVGWVRGFASGVTSRDQLPPSAARVQFSGVLAYWDPADPVGWTNYVTSRVLLHRALTSQWEVWNEPPNHTPNTPPEDYGRMVALAYDAVKRQDPDIQVGLAAQSVNLNYLDRALQAGAKDKFDFITLHPYETGDLIPQGFEAQYMSIVPTVRKMLALRNPARANVPVYFTEIGQPLKGQVNEVAQASQLIKYFVMGIAQGVERVHWFEPLDGDSGPFGLIDGRGGLRPSYQALRHLIAQLGQQPKYLGWLRPNDRFHGFLFEREDRQVLVTWSPPGQAGELVLPTQARVIDPLSGQEQVVQRLPVGPVPTLVVLPASGTNWMAQAKANRLKAYPWSGKKNPAESQSVTVTAQGDRLQERGLYFATKPGGPEQGAIDASATPRLHFTVDPAFLSYTSQPIEITAVVRPRAGAGAPAGFNLKYESSSGTKTVGWNKVAPGEGWSTLTWRLDDPQFVGKFGYHFTFDADSKQHSGYLVQRVTVTKRP